MNFSKRRNSFNKLGFTFLKHNKGITDITYNHLNLPKKITFAGNNTITYIYNASGVKIRKTVTEADTQANTSYLGSFQYNKNTLKYNHTAEVNVRHTPPTSGTNYGAFDYVLKQQNLRLRGFC